MYPLKNLVFVVVFGAGTGLTGLLIHNHIVSVRAAKLEQSGAAAPYFPAGSVWTTEVSQDHVDPQSATIIGWLANAGGFGTGRMLVDFNIRVLQATAGTPFVPFKKGDPFYEPDSDNIKTFPLPVGGGSEGHTNSYVCDNNTSDCHLLVVDRANAKLYEAYQATYENNALTAHFVAVWDLNRVYPPSGRGEQCTSADAAGFPIAPLLFNADEIASGKIDHAIRFTLPNWRMRAGYYVHPATHAGGPTGPISAPPYGVHLRLKSNYDVLQLKPAAQIVARALQKYGMFLADGGNIALTAQSDQDTTMKWTDVDFGAHDLQDLKVTDFEVVDMGTPIRTTYECVRNK
jgi:serine/threonine-protein kinase